MAKHQEPCELCARIATCRDGTHPGVIAELDTGWAVLGDSQFFLGYSVLWCKEPATELDELAPHVRSRFLQEMAQLAHAVRLAVGPHKLNYESLGNLVHHLHWHVFPRRLTDPDPKAPVWGQMPAGRAGEAYRFDPIKHKGLLESIRRELRAIRDRETKEEKAR